MNKNIFKSFIEECSKETISDWAEKRGFDIKLLEKLKIGKCNHNSMKRLVEKYSMDSLKENGFLNSKNQWKYSNRIIIPFTEDYFSAREINPSSNKFKNLFPIGLSKKIFFLDGKENNDLYICEGETDTIRLKQVFNDSNILSIGGSKSKNLIPELIKKIIEYKPNRIIFAFDNDDAGKEAIEEFIILLASHSKKEYYDSKVFKLIFPEDNKDIDDYFFYGGKIEDLKYEPIELPIEEKNNDSIYGNLKVNPLNLLIDNYTKNVEIFYEKQPFFNDKTGMFWFWKGDRYEQLDDTDVMNMLDDKLGFMGQTVNSKLRSHYLEAFRRVGRKHIPTDAPKKWVQFKNKAYSLNSGNIYEVKPNYFFCNPIPWDLGESDKTPIMDKLFEEWVGKENIQTLYELMAYCCYTDYPIQLLFCLVGCGRNGKGCFLKILDKFIGKDNVTSTSLDLISGNNRSRFESFRLYKKLVALMGETNFGMLSNTSLIKQLTGGDKIGFEKKGKDPFSEYNYAKIIIASNSLPTSTDTSDGFYRRWFIIDFPNEFQEGKDITKTIPGQEYNNLALKITKILPTLISDGKFTNQGEIEERRQKYIMASNPLPFFIKQCCFVQDNCYILYNELYMSYIKLLKKLKRRRISRKEFKTALEDEGFWIEKTSKNIDNDWKSGFWIDGLELNFDRFDFYTKNPNSFLTCKSDMEIMVKKEKKKMKNLHRKHTLITLI